MGEVTRPPTDERRAAVGEPIAQLASTIAHDLNNLLLIVAASGERLNRRSHLTSDDRLELERILVAATHAAALTSQLLAASRGGSPPGGSAELGTAIARTARLLEHTIGERVRIELSLADRPAWVAVHESEIAQLLINLALNARDAMPNGGVLRIATSIAEAPPTNSGPATDDQYVRIDVEDSGTGMSAEVKARAFDRFFTTKPAGRGTGIGLWSVRRTVEQHGGHVAVVTEPGAGACFTIHLPMLREAPPSASAAADEPVLAARPGETVLVAEDEPVVREIVGDILRGFGYDVVEVDSGEAALTAVAAAERRIDVLVTDIAMADVSGLELARRFAALAPEMRIILMSGYDDGAMRGEAGAPAGVPLLPKPFTSRALGRAVRELLDAAQPGQAR